MSNRVSAIILPGRLRGNRPGSRCGGRSAGLYPEAGAPLSEKTAFPCSHIPFPILGLSFLLGGRKDNPGTFLPDTVERSLRFEKAGVALFPINSIRARYPYRLQRHHQNDVNTEWSQVVRGCLGTGFRQFQQSSEIRPPTSIFRADPHAASGGTNRV